MKIIAFWIAGLILLFSTILFLFSCATPKKVYQVYFDNSVCIMPYSDYTYKTGSEIDIIIDNELFTIPTGFETDLASIPRWYWSFLSPQYSAFVTPSIIHDYFYRCENLKNRDFADSVFYYALLNNGVSRYTASKFYMAVRLFGAHSYSKDKECISIEKTRIENGLLADSH